MLHSTIVRIAWSLAQGQGRESGWVCTVASAYQEEQDGRSDEICNSLHALRMPLKDPRNEISWKKMISFSSSGTGEQMFTATAAK